MVTLPRNAAPMALDGKSSVTNRASCWRPWIVRVTGAPTGVPSSSRNYYNGCRRTARVRNRDTQIAADGLNHVHEKRRFRRQWRRKNGPVGLNGAIADHPVSGLNSSAEAVIERAIPEVPPAISTRPSSNRTIAAVPRTSLKGPVGVQDPESTIAKLHGLLPHVVVEPDGVEIVKD